MRSGHWTTVAVAAAGTLAVAGVATGASSEAQTLRGCRGATQFVVLFWPSGHPAVRSLRFPAFRLPHTEIFAGSRQVGYLEIGGRGGPLARTGDCARAAADARPPTVPAVRRTAALIICRFTRAPRFLRQAGRGRATVTAIVPRSRSGIRITMRAGRSVVSYDPAACRAAPPPR